jgi:tetratricopeptide (TPR) repeat protein
VAVSLADGRALVSAANALGAVFKDVGELEAAGVVYRRALAVAEGMTVPDPLTEAGLLRNLGGLAFSIGDAAGGIPLAERGLALRIGALGDAHPDVARDLDALSALYHQAGRYRDADEACQQALRVLERCYGPDHFDVAMICARLAAMRADQGDFSSAEALGRRSLRIVQIVLGPEDVEAGLAMLNLATAIAGQGRSGEAAAFADCASAILGDRLPAGHPHVLAARDVMNEFREIA